MLAAETAVDKSVGTYVALEEIALSTTPTGAAYAWNIAKPSASTDRCVLSSDTDAGPTFTPDVEGFYTLTCVVDSTTTYILRAAVAAIGAVSSLSAIRFMPIANAAIPTPASGRTVYFSSDANALVEKRADGSVHTLDVT
jgi:hypothetical protein